MPIYRITNAVKESGGLKERLFHTAYNAKRQAILNGKNGMKYVKASPHTVSLEVEKTFPMSFEPILQLFQAKKLTCRPFHHLSLVYFII